MDKIELIKDKLIKLYQESGYFETAIKGFKISKRDETTKLKKCFYTPLAILLLQ